MIKKTETSFQYFPTDRAAKEFGRFHDLVSLWQSKAGPNQLPKWGDFLFSDFRGWHARMAVSDTTSLRNDVIFRIYGNDLIGWQHTDLTGHSFKEKLPDAYDKIYRKHFTRLLSEPAISLGTTSIASDRDTYVTMDVLHLPLCETGTTVTRILHFCCPRFNTLEADQQVGEPHQDAAHSPSN